MNFFIGEYEQHHEDIVPEILKENYHHMLKIERWNFIIFIVAMLSVFWTSFVWAVHLGWLILEPDLKPYSHLYYLSYGYWLAYFLIFKKVKLGYLLMWIIYFIMVSGIIAFFGYQFNRMLLHLDFWINSALTLWGVYNRDIRFRNLLNRNEK
ncbi:hypothetical protein NMU03_11175 [Allocoprobacillus halotolerans]|uniref:Preprotein translocase subunit SecA n=1 Tax=Allocoprobacillus halotolerans TaxID=2944914 RepID=A0ABY5I2M4_9FIRM|nr:hypothetical protein [Allocoprobacillus halotolerans]UTY38237.1 hypothetical protein NMU03_11175 [Allocoprobacillus halotolerans]